jgi:hypothetical protein
MDLTKLRKELAAVMKRDNLNAINVASACDVNEQTVERFIDGVGVPRRITLRAFQQFVESKNSISQPVASRQTAS